MWTRDVAITSIRRTAREDGMLDAATQLHRLGLNSALPKVSSASVSSSCLPAAHLTNLEDAYGHSEIPTKMVIRFQIIGDRDEFQYPYGHSEIPTTLGGRALLVGGAVFQYPDINMSSPPKGVASKRPSAVICDI